MQLATRRPVAMADVSAGGGSGPAALDFATTSAAASAAFPPPTHAQQPDEPGGNSHVHYALSIDPGLAASHSATSGAQPGLTRSDTEAALSPGIRRRPTRAGTFRTVDDFDDFTVRPGWHRTFPGGIMAMSPANLYLHLQLAPNPAWTRANQTVAMPPCRR